MPDVLQQRDADGTVLCDLAPASFAPWFLVRDSLEVHAPRKNRVTATQPGPYGGELVLRETRENGSLGAAWAVVGASQDECWELARDLIACFERVAGHPSAGLDDLRLYWRPEGVASAHAASFRQQGSADWDWAYSWAQLTLGAASGQGLLQLTASWAVLPYTW